MAETIDYISINDIFWIQFKSHLVSFGFKGLPDGTHFTIGFDERSPDINFHVTKNATNPKDKPQIKIIVIDKQILEEVAPSLTLSMLNKILEPLDMKELKAKYDYDLGFISFDRLQNSEASSLTEQRLIDSFKDISRFRRKTQLKVEGDIEKRIESFATSEHLQQALLDNIVELSDEFEKYVEGGMILTEDNALQVIRINERWYSIRTDIKPFDILCAFVNPRLARHLVWNTKRALVAVKHSKKYSDTENLNKPIRLIRQTVKNATTQQ